MLVPGFLMIVLVGVLALVVLLACLLAKAIKTLVSGNYHAVIVGLGALGGVVLVALLGIVLSVRLVSVQRFVGPPGPHHVASRAPTAFAVTPAESSPAVIRLTPAEAEDAKPTPATVTQQTDAEAAEKPTAAAEKPAPAAEKSPPAPEPATPAAEQPTPRPVEPLATPIVTEPVRVTLASRPRWVDSDPVLIGDVQQRSVSSGPYEKLRDCLRALDEQLKKAVDEYVDEYFDEAYGKRLKVSQIVHYDANWIKSHLLGPDGIYQETVQVSFGPMQQIHARLVFDAAFRQELDGRRPDLDRQCRALMATSRLLVTALGFGFLLSVLGVVYGYFKLDAATHAGHSRRLQFLGGAAILALTAAVVCLARQITWM
jgi:hypothetical protein